MDVVISVFVVLTIPQFVVPDVLSEAPFRAVLKQVSGDSRVFSGESIRLKCSIPEDQKSTWQYLWFRGTKQLPQTGEDLILWNVKSKEGGMFYCQGVRETVVGQIHTQQSLPVDIKVDGGWAILHVTPHSGLVGDSLKMTCNIRGNPQPQEVILYKDGVEVMRQKGINPQFHLTNIGLEHQGLYSCRATWDVRIYSHSVISVATPVYVSEILTQPVLEITFGTVTKMKLFCSLHYNARAPAPPIHYYFYKNGKQLGPSSSENSVVISPSPGQYRCKARVPKLGLLRWSDTKNFGQVPDLTGTKQKKHPSIFQPRPTGPQIAAPDFTLPPVDQPTPASSASSSSSSPHQSTAAPTCLPPTKEDSPLPPTQPEPLLPDETRQSTKQTIPELFEMSGDSPTNVP
ncbi:hypothetical protein LDENG_00010410 [Lucifuga dentata]|nr:hypothetical protein LDENG_00010410 [Lucifuga dentata]